MNSLAIFTSLLALASAMQPAVNVNSFTTAYKYTDRIGLHAFGDTDLNRKSYGVLQASSHPKPKYRFVAFDTQEWNDSFPLSSSVFELEEDGRITMMVNGTTVELRAVKGDSGFLTLVAVSIDEPMRPEDENRFAILCNGDGDNSWANCMIELMGPLVPYRGNPEDMRPLVIDQDVKISGNLLLWPKTGNRNQIFAVGANRPRSFFENR